MTSYWNDGRYIMNVSCGNRTVLQNVLVDFLQFYTSIPNNMQFQENQEFQVVISSDVPGVMNFITAHSDLSETFSIKLISYDSHTHNVLLFNTCRLVGCQWSTMNVFSSLPPKIILSFVCVHQRLVRNLRIESKPARKLSHNWQVNGF